MRKNTECDFELELASGLEGMVRDPEGNVVAQADVIVLGSGNPVMVRNGEVLRNRDFAVSTNDHGRYVPPQDQDIGILLIHSQQAIW